MIIGSIILSDSSIYNFSYTKIENTTTIGNRSIFRDRAISNNRSGNIAKNIVFDISSTTIISRSVTTKSAVFDFSIAEYGNSATVSRRGNSFVVTNGTINNFSIAISEDTTTIIFSTVATNSAIANSNISWTPVVNTTTSIIS